MVQNQTCLYTSGRTIVCIAAYIGIIALVLLALIPNSADLGQAQQYFAVIVIWLNVVALSVLLLRRRTFKLGLSDIALLLVTVYVSLNYFCISPVSAQEKYVEFLSITGGILSLRIIISEYRHIVHLIFVGIIAVGFVEALIGLSQLFGWSASNHRLFAVTGTFLNPGPYGGYLAVTVSMAVGYMVCRHQWFDRNMKGHLHNWNWTIKHMVVVTYLLCGITSCIAVMVLAATKSRAAWIGLGISVFILVISRRAVQDHLHLWRKRYKWKIALWSTGIFFTLITLGIALYYFKPASANGRLLMWNISTRIIAENPTFGAGFGSFGGVYGNTQAEYFLTHPDSSFIPVADAPQYAFNEYLQVGVELGLIGVILFMTLLCTTLYRLISHQPPFGYGLLVLLILALFSYPFQLLPFQILLMLFIGISDSLAGKSTISAHRAEIVARVVLVIFAVVNVYNLKSYSEKIQATARWKKEKIRYDYGYYTDVINSYQSLLSQLNDNPAFLFEYGHALYKSGHYAISNQIFQVGMQLSSDPMFYNLMGNNYKVQGDYAAAERAYWRAYYVIPNRIYPLYLLTELYAQSGQEAKMRAMGRRVLDFEEKVPSSAVREIKSHVRKLLE